MKQLTVTDVRSLPADSAFLLDDGKTAILYDTGFAFTGSRIADNIQKQLGSRELDYIFLTHSHYDHVLGSVSIRKRYPKAKVVASEYTKTIFSKPSAREMMRDLDRKFAAKCGVSDYEDRIDDLRVDITVKDGEQFRCGDLVFTALALPGHTKCSVGFYLEETRLLLSTETLGVYFGNGVYLPSYLVGVQMTLDSFRKAKQLDISGILLPHYGLLKQEEAGRFLKESEEMSLSTARLIRQMLLSGASEEDVVDFFRKTYYTDTVSPVYPLDAFLLNTGIMVKLVRKEWM